MVEKMPTSPATSEMDSSSRTPVQQQQQSSADATELCAQSTTVLATSCHSANENNGPRRGPGCFVCGDRRCHTETHRRIGTLPPDYCRPPSARNNERYHETSSGLNVGSLRRPMHNVSRPPASRETLAKILARAIGIRPTSIQVTSK